jgi:hypothetical protein
MNRLGLTLLAGALIVPAAAPQNPTQQLPPFQAALAACEDTVKPAPPTPAQNEAGRVSTRFLANALTKLAPTIARTTHGDVQPSDIAQVAAETEAQKAREKQEHAKYCAALKEAAKKATAQPTTKVIEACPPNTQRAAGTPYCLKGDATLVDVLHITVPITPPASSPTTLTPAPPASAAPATAQQR